MRGSHQNKPSSTESKLELFPSHPAVLMVVGNHIGTLRKGETSKFPVGLFHFFLPFSPLFQPKPFSVKVLFPLFTSWLFW